MKKTKHDPFTGDTLPTQGHKQVESKKMKKIYHANINQTKPGEAILISDKYIL